MAAALVFRLQRGPRLLREVLLERGWEEFEGGERGEHDWNLYWRGSAFCSAQYRALLPWQRLNHHPKTAGITRKDCLARNLRRMKATFGSPLLDFSPASFILPNDYTRFLSECARRRRRSGGGAAAVWICKPAGRSRGRGVFLFRDARELAYDGPAVVQRYISRPLLVSGYKLDLRLYVGVTSFHPLTVYVHQEGLVRFATEKYDLSAPRNPFAHLTNASINKRGPSYAAAKGRVGPGCKWTLGRFRHFLRGQEVDELLLWQRISNVVTLTLLAAAPGVPACPNCVELFGFDVLIDGRLKPWLLEVNASPALSLDCQADEAVKRRLVGDLIDLMDYAAADGLRGRPAAAAAAATAPATEHKRRRNEAPTELPLLRPVDTRRHQHGAGTRRPPVAVETGHPAPMSTRSRQRSEVTGSCSTPGSTPRGRGFTQPHVSWRLPDIHRDTRRRRLPPPRVGDFIRTFPLNGATLRASLHQLDVGAIVQELQRITGRLAARRGDGTRRREEEQGGGGGGGGEEECDALLWGPSDPPLLSQLL